MNRLALLGAGGHGKVVADAALSAGWNDVVFYDDRWPDLQTLGPWNVIGATNDLLRQAGEATAAIVAVGDNKRRLALQRQLVGAGVPIGTIIHPRAAVSRFAKVGLGTVVLAGAVLNPFALVGAAVIINTGATVDHDCLLDDGVHVSPGAHLGGTVRVGEATWIGLGAAVRHCVTIGEYVTVGAGAVVVGDVASGLTVFGVPARARKEAGGTSG